MSLNRREWWASIVGILLGRKPKLSLSGNPLTFVGGPRCGGKIHQRQLWVMDTSKDIVFWGTPLPNKFKAKRSWVDDEIDRKFYEG